MDCQASQSFRPIQTLFYFNNPLAREFHGKSEVLILSLFKESNNGENPKGTHGHFLCLPANVSCRHIYFIRYRRWSVRRHDVEPLLEVLNAEPPGSLEEQGPVVLISSIWTMYNDVCGDSVAT